FEGFTEDISKCTSFDELPENCKKYIERLEELVVCHVSMVGVGPDRAQVIER
ncbi:MAG: adenylosuccinate synthetase, partial [Ruminococcus sp.]|nr:adenylosuccinate synthetase [Ruminococcus sp.]